MALAMVEGAERDGLISAGDTVVEYTGGSTGPALALVCRTKGYRPLIVIAEVLHRGAFSADARARRRARRHPIGGGPADGDRKDIENMVARAAELASAPGHYATDQFNNPYVVPDHRDRLGREIWDRPKAA